MTKKKYNLKLAVVMRFVRTLIPQIPAVIAFVGNYGPEWLAPVLIFVGSVATAGDKLYRELKK